MTPEARASLAEQLLSNPLFTDLFDSIEKSAVERMIYAADEETRAKDALRVQAIRALRDECDTALRTAGKRRTAQD